MYRGYMRTRPDLQASSAVFHPADNTNCPRTNNRGQAADIPTKYVDVDEVLSTLKTLDLLA